jgi:hypothetical protein
MGTCAGKNKVERKMKQGGFYQRGNLVQCCSSLPITFSDQMEYFFLIGVAPG